MTKYKPTMIYKNSLIIITALFFSIIVNGQQKVQLPKLDSLLISVDRYYNNLTNAQSAEFEAFNKYTWMNLLPSPGYSPFTGGFSVSVNLGQSWQYLRSKHTETAKTKSIARVNQLAAGELKRQVIAAHEVLKIMAAEYNGKDSIDFLTQKSYDLAAEQYKRNELPPSAFLTFQNGYYQYKTSRTLEYDNIIKAIFAIMVQAKMQIIPSNND